MVEYENYYDLLDVAPDATTDQIRAAYREKAKEYHPDVSEHPNAETVFKRITTAKEVLTDDAERKEYDRRTHTDYITSPKQRPEPAPQKPHYPSQTSQTTTTSKQAGQRRAKHRDPPDPDEWVGEPRWSQPKEERSEHSTKTVDQSPPDWTKDTPSYVIPPRIFQPAILLGIVAYPILLYGVISPTVSPVLMALSSILFASLYFVLAATRLGFYVFGTWMILTPLLCSSIASLELVSARVITATLIPCLGFLITIIVTSIDP